MVFSSLFVQFLYFIDMSTITSLDQFNFVCHTLPVTSFCLFSFCVDGPSLPKDELWVKIGGDKGGGSFKMAMQIVNQPQPNSADHTVVFSCLEAGDSVANLHVCLDYFQQHIHEMQDLSLE